MIRNILSIVSGLFVAFSTLIIVEMSNSAIHASSNIDLSSNLELPFSFWVILIGGWILGSFLAGLVARLMSKKQSKIFPIILGLILIASSVANFTMIKHPIWVMIISIPSFLIFSFLGFNLKIKRNDW